MSQNLGVNTPCGGLARKLLSKEYLKFFTAWVVPGCTKPEIRMPPYFPRPPSISNARPRSQELVHQTPFWSPRGYENWRFDVRQLSAKLGRGTRVRNTLSKFQSVQNFKSKNSLSFKDPCLFLYPIHIKDGSLCIFLFFLNYCPAYLQQSIPIIR